MFSQGSCVFVRKASGVIRSTKAGGIAFQAGEVNDVYGRRYDESAVPSAWRDPAAYLICGMLAYLLRTAGRERLNHFHFQCRLRFYDLAPFVPTPDGGSIALI